MAAFCLMTLKSTRDHSGGNS